MIGLWCLPRRRTRGNSRTHRPNACPMNLARRLRLPRPNGYLALSIAQSVGLLLARGCTADISLSKGEIDPEAEQKYEEVWAENWEGMQQISLSECNKGGSIEGCMVRSNEVIAHLDKFQSDLGSIEIPSRFLAANKAVTKALDRLEQGFRLRNHGLQINSDPEFVAGNDMLEEANAQCLTHTGSSRLITVRNHRLR